MESQIEKGRKMIELEKADLIGQFENNSAEWHNARQGSVGGSQVGTILGVNPWESTVTAFYKFTGQISDEIKPSMSMRLGTKLEAPILEIFAEEHPDYEMLGSATYASKVNTRFHANPDQIIRLPDGSLGVVEVKFSRDYWTEVPKHYEMQLRWYMGVLGIDYGVFAVLAGSSYLEFEIHHDQFQYEAMIAAVNRFLDHCDQKIQPEWDGSNSTYETVRALNPNINPDDTEELGDLGMYLSLAHGELELAETKYRELQSRVLDAMGSAKWGAVNDEVILYRTQRGNGAPYLTWKKKGK
jgi:putative phage-type endonuclease